MKKTITLNVNGRAVSAEVEPRTQLADFVREQLLLTGTHLGCEHGVCGACTIEVDGAPARSCIASAAACDGARVRTIEQGLPLVRAANTGISAVIDPVGRIVKSLPLGAEGVLDASLPRRIDPRNQPTVQLELVNAVPAIDRKRDRPVRPPHFKRPVLPRPPMLQPERPNLPRAVVAVDVPTA